MRTHRKSPPRRPGWRLSLQSLEDRRTPAVRVWTGLGADDLWGNAANWDTGVPADGDDVASRRPPASAEVFFDSSGVTINSLTSDGTNPVSEPFRLAGGNLALTGSGPFAFGSELTMEGGILSGTATVVVGGAFAWTAGTMKGGGTTELAGTATLTMSGAANKVLEGHTLVNDGTVTLSQGNLLLRDFSLLDNNGTLNVTDEADLVESNNANSRFRNDGTFTKTGAGHDHTPFRPPLRQQWHRPRDLRHVATEAHGGTSTAGTFDVAGGAALEFANDYTLDAASSVSGAGAGLFTGGTVTINGTYALGGPTTISGGATFNTPTTFTTLNLVSGRLGGSGALVVGSALNWTEGTMEGGGTTTVAGTATLTMSGPGNKVSPGPDPGERRGGHPEPGEPAAPRCRPVRQQRNLYRHGRGGPHREQQRRLDVPQRRHVHQERCGHGHDFDQPAVHQ